MLKEGEEVVKTGIVDLDALMEHLRSLPQPPPGPGDGPLRPRRRG